jgi:high frequency lysogenization protein
MAIISPPDRDLTLALAGVFQSAELVHQVARLDQFDQQAMYESSYSLIRLDAESIQDVYGSETGGELGLRTMIKLFSRQADDATREIYTYVVAMHQLGLKLNKFQKASDVIRGELEEMQERFIRNQAAESGLDALHESLADLYTRTISHLTPRIIVQGDPEKLQQPSSVNRIRALLFSGIRSAFLWHQLGGRRWKLVIGRKDYVNMARRILSG